MSGVSISEEQRLRIEENKKRALAKRQQLSAQNTTVQQTNLNPNATTFIPRASTSTSTSGAQLKTRDRSRQTHTTDTWNKKAKNTKQSSAIAKSQFYGQIQSKPVKGQCVLISRDRFEVKMSFHQAVVEVFQTIPSRVYDANKRKWSFNIRDHNTILKAVSGLQPLVQVEPLPRSILRVFGGKAPPSESAGISVVPQADLSEVDEILVSSLMPFQREGVNFGVHLKGRVLIADDMGLGKTLQAICLACVYRSKWPLLIVTPSSVRFDWAQQIRRWVPSLEPHLIQVATTGKDDPTCGLVNIISYDLLSRQLKRLTAARFKVIIMDESHFLKNHKTVRTKAALPLLQSAQHVMLLSGTPALSRPVELYTQIVAVCPRMFKFHEFGERYCEAKEQTWGWDYSGSSNMEELHLLMEDKIMIRRMKQDVLTQLPAKRRQMVVLDPVSVATSRSLIHASKTMDKKMSGMEKRGALLQYFHETSKVKVPAVRDYVMDMVLAEKKFIIFAHHQEMLDSIEEAVASENVEYIRIDGRTKSEQRNFFCRKFQSRDECKVAVLSITAANAGLNLAAASIVVFAELFWNPGILVQAEDRVHRLGQLDAVIVYYLVAQKTADDYIWPLVQNKLQVLGKAGLAGEDFANADTTHIRDPKQKRILDMFEESFLEESAIQEEAQDGVSPSPEQPTGSPPKTPTSSPLKRKATGSPWKHKFSPSKGQTGIGQFFQVDSIRSARSPQKAEAAASNNSEILDCGKSDSREPVCKKLELSPTSNADGGAQPQNNPPQNPPQSHLESDSVCGVPSTEWDEEMSEEVLAELAADVDWDEDSESDDDEPKLKRFKVSSR